MASLEDNLYQAFAKAETGGVPDPWIRTMSIPKQGSTAYGPVQITKTLAEGYVDKHKDLFTPEELAYLERFIEQGNLFAEFGREPNKEGYDPKFEYGGSGILTSDEDKALYERVAKKMLKQHYKNNKGDLSKTIKEWRFGASSKKSKSNDPRYWREVEQTFIDPPEQPEPATTQQPLQAPESLSMGYIDELVEMVRSRLEQPQRASQAPSRSNIEEREEQLERTANEAQLETDAREAEEDKLTTEAVEFTAFEQSLIDDAVSGFETETEIKEDVDVEFTPFEQQLIAYASGTEETEAPVYAREEESNEQERIRTLF